MSATETSHHMLHTAAFTALESSINAALAYDPGTRGALEKLQGKVLEVKTTAPSLQFFIAPCAQGVQIMGHFEGEVTTRLHGPLAALFALVVSDNTSLANSQVDMFGSSTFLNNLQQVLKQLDIDWEEPLSQLTGDVVGHETAALIRKSCQWLGNRANTTKRLLSEYLTEELRSVPAKVEVAHFCDAVDDIRLSTDRLAATIAQLTQAAEHLRAQANR